MAHQQLIDYIKQQMDQGTDRQQIKETLLAGGWQENDIEEAFSAASGPGHPPPLPPSPFSISSAPSFPGATQILKEAWKLYKQRIGVFLGVMVAPTLAAIVAIVLFAGGGFLGMLGSSMLHPGLAVGFYGLLVGLVVLLVIIIMVIQIWGQVALLYAIKDSEEEIGVMEAYRRGWYRVLSYWWIVFLTMFITFGGFMFFLVPGIIFFVWFSLAAYVLVAEDLKGMNALLKSREYVKGRWGGVWWRLLFISSLYLIASITVTGLLALLDAPLVEKIGGYVVTLFLSPLFAVYMYLVYNHLRSIRGELVFNPEKKQKILILTAGIAGFLLIPFLIWLFVSLGVDSAAVKARDARRVSDLKQTQLGLDMYYDWTGAYPSSLDEIRNIEFLSDFRIPTDPITGLPYEYRMMDEGQNYVICAKLEEKGRGKNCVNP